jgi:hypothetical protein
LRRAVSMDILHRPARVVVTSLGKPRPAATAGRPPPYDEASSPPDVRPTLLDGSRAKLEKLAQRVDGRATGHRHPVASRLASPRRWTRRSQPRHHGRPPIGPQVRALVCEMATANPLWGAPRIHGELRTLGVHVSERTVSRLLEQHTRPAPQTWKTTRTRGESGRV